MDRKTLSAGTALTIFDEIDSTSAEARRRIASGTGADGWLMARRQTAGYGRRGRGWAQNEGDLAATLALTMGQVLAANPAAAGFALSLALDEALQAQGIKASDIKLKWPNDVLLKDGKVSGILLEREETESGPVLVIGIGLNIVSKPDLPDYPTACLSDILDLVPLPEELLDTLDTAVMTWLAHLETQGFADLRETWLSRAGGIGNAITVRLPNETLHGVFEGLDASGALLLRQGEVIRPISTGDVFFGAGYASNGG